MRPNFKDLTEMQLFLEEVCMSTLIFSVHIHVIGEQGGERERTRGGRRNNWLDEKTLWGEKAAIRGA